MLKHIRKLILCAALFAAAGCAAQENIEADQLSVKFFNAGKADAILLYTDESAVLIDTGLDGFAPYILHTLNELDIQTLDTLILTHLIKTTSGVPMRSWNPSMSDGSLSPTGPRTAMSTPI